MLKNKQPLPIAPLPWQLPKLANGTATLILAPVQGNVCPYSPGDKVYVPEVWIKLSSDPPMYVQKEWLLSPDDDEFYTNPVSEYLIKNVDKFNWQPAKTMPPEAARIHLGVDSVEEIEFGQLTGEDEKSMGWPCDDMPGFYRDDVKLWAVRVHAIAPL